MEGQENAGMLDLDADDLERFEPGRLLNDKIINAYFELLASHGESVQVFSTFFYSTLAKRGVEWVQRWTAGTDIFASNLILIPVHLPSHWILVVVDPGSMVLEYYDSLGGMEREVVCRIRKYLRAEWCRRRSSELRFVVVIKKRIPLQANGFDCGVFVCMFARHRLEGCTRWPSPARMCGFRARLRDEVSAGRILYGLSCPEHRGDSLVDPD